MVHSHEPNLHRFSRFLETNDYLPSHVSEVQALVCEQRRKSERLNFEIHVLGRTLESLEAECEALRVSMLGFDSIRAPIRRLPPETLDDIFYHCIPTHRNPVMSFADAPLLLMCVCRTWEAAVLSSPRLWRRLHIPLYLPRRRVVGLETWLSRSGGSLLSISISHQGNDPVLYAGEEIEGIVIKRIFDSVFSVTSRIEELELSIPYQTYVLLLSGVSHNSFPMLKRLRLYFTISGYADIPPDAFTMPFVQTQLLQSLSVGWYRTSVLYDLGDNLSTSSLTSISLHTSVTSIIAMKIFCMCHKLKHCKMAIANYRDVLHVNSSDQIAFLPDLVSLILTVDVNTGQRIKTMYSNIHAPQLVCFGYLQHFENNPVGLPSIGAIAAQSSPGLHSMLIKSSLLTKLIFNSGYLAVEDLDLCLRSSGQVTHLELGVDEASRTENEHGSDSHDQSFDLKILLIPQSNGPFTEEAKSPSFYKDGATTSEEIVLPKLEIFVGQLMPNWTSDDIVENFIVGRLGTAASRRGISPLKKVRMRFRREQEYDVKSNIEQLTNETRTDSDLLLDLKYNEPLGDYYWQSAFAGIV